MIAPKAEQKSAVMQWLKNNLDASALIDDRGDSLKVRATAREVEKLFDTELNIFTHDQGHQIIRAMGATSVPLNIHGAIEFVGGLNDFTMYRPSSQKTPKPDSDTVQATTPVIIPES